MIAIPINGDIYRLQKFELNDIISYFIEKHFFFLKYKSQPH